VDVGTVRGYREAVVLLTDETTAGTSGRVRV
jgi:hypothetical protein